jgi:hypothetical protein
MLHFAEVHVQLAMFARQGGGGKRAEADAPARPGCGFERLSKRRHKKVRDRKRR